MSAEKADSRRSFGEGTPGRRGSPVPTPRPGAGATGTEGSSEGCGSVRRVAGSATAGAGAAALSCSGSGAAAAGAGRSSAVSWAVLRKSCESGPSRMLARLAVGICEDLLRELTVGVSGDPVGVVLEHRHALHRRLGEAHGLTDPRGD